MPSLPGPKISASQPIADREAAVSGAMAAGPETSKGITRPAPAHLPRSGIAPSLRPAYFGDGAQLEAGGFQALLREGHVLDTFQVGSRHRWADADEHLDGI